MRVLRRALLTACCGLSVVTPVLADCGGASTCCSDSATLYSCRRVTVTSIVMPTGNYVRAPAGYQMGDPSIGVTAANIVAPTNCFLESNSIFRLQRSDTNYETLLSALQTAKVTGLPVDISSTMTPGQACRIDTVVVY